MAIYYSHEVEGDLPSEISPVGTLSPEFYPAGSLTLWNLPRSFGWNCPHRNFTRSFDWKCPRGNVPTLENGNVPTGTVSTGKDPELMKGIFPAGTLTTGIVPIGT